MAWIRRLGTWRTIAFAIVLLDSLLAVKGQTLLQNGDFAIGPTNSSNTDQEVPLIGQDALAGWKVQGTVQYVSSGGNISLPHDNHGVELGLNGQISQVFSPYKLGSPYVLTFSIGKGGETDECEASNPVNITISPYSQVFEQTGQYTPESWDTYAWGFVAQDDTLDLIFKSQSDPLPNFSCRPVISTISVTELKTPESTQGNLLLNGDFEQGPSMPLDSSYGILLAPTADPSSSSLPGWTIGPLMPLKYIDSTHFYVPKGAAAVELVSPQQGSIQQNVTTVPGLVYGLGFEIGDGNNSCAGNMTVKLQMGPLIETYSYTSEGSGGKEFVSTGFKAATTSTSISFTSLSNHYKEDVSLCGPVIDNVILTVASSSLPLSVIILSCFTSLAISLSFRV